MKTISRYFHEEINEYGLEVNLLTDVEIDDIFYGRNRYLITLNPQYVLCKFIINYADINRNIEEGFCYSKYYEIFNSYSETNDVALYYLAYGVYNDDPTFYVEDNQKELIKQKIGLLNSDKHGRLFRIFGLIHLSENLIVEAKRLFLIGVEKLDVISANELFRIYEKENDFDVTYNFCIKSINLGIDLHNIFFDFLYKSKRFDLLAKHYSEILLSGTYVNIGKNALTEIFREYEKIILELKYKPGSQGFIEAKDHFESLI